jgi:hypothetical protein
MVPAGDAGWGRVLLGAALLDLTAALPGAPASSTASAAGQVFLNDTHMHLVDLMGRSSPTSRSARGVGRRRERLHIAPLVDAELRRRSSSDAYARPQSIE